MKVKVISVFRDKFTGKYYTPGEVIEVGEEARVLDMESRRLAERIEAKNTEVKAPSDFLMIFAPHILQVKVITPMAKDEFGRPIPGTGGEYWQEVGKCRCDDNTTKEFSSDNGSVYRPNYHVVCEKRITVKAGDEVRCMDGDGVRGQGEVYTVKSTNYFNYSELWM